MSGSNNAFPLDLIPEIQQHPGDFRLLRRIPITADGALEGRLPWVFNERQADDRVAHAIFLDTETTGLKHDVDKIIELGMVQVSYSYSRRLNLSIEKV